MNGIVGLKPTRGLVGTAGVVPACRSLDCVSACSRATRRRAAVLAVLAGPDPADPWSRVPQAVDRRPAETARGSRWPTGLDFAGDAAMAAAFAAVAEACRRPRRRTTVPVPVAPLIEAGDLLYTGPWVAERLAGLEGFLADAPRRRPAGHPRGHRARPRVHRRRRLPRPPPAAGAARGVRAAGGRADVLLLPTVPTTFTRAQLAAEPVARNLVARPLHAVRQPARPRRPRRPGRHHARRAAGRRHPARPRVRRGPADRRRPRVDQSGSMIPAEEAA